MIILLLTWYLDSFTWRRGSRNWVWCFLWKCSIQLQDLNKGKLDGNKKSKVKLGLLEGTESPIETVKALADTHLPESINFSEGNSQIFETLDEIFQASSVESKVSPCLVVNLTFCMYTIQFLLYHIMKDKWNDLKNGLSRKRRLRQI